MALESGFDLVGITSAEVIPEAKKYFYDWLKNGYAGDLEYMKKAPERRSNPQKILPDAKSVICLAINYYCEDLRPKDFSKKIYGKLARYSVYRDYHKVIEKMLKVYVKKLNVFFEDDTKIFRYYVDHGPILERAYAQMAGIGFIGKNGMVISEKYGSWILLAEIITNVELDFDDPARPQCGDCNKCMVACPTNAIVKERIIDARKCISYQTIENKSDQIDKKLRVNIGNRIFGCDVCQEVCPFNKQPIVSSLEKRVENVYVDVEQLLKSTEDEFHEKYQGTAIRRAKLKGLKRNAKVVKMNVNRLRGKKS